VKAVLYAAPWQKSRPGIIETTLPLPRYTRPEGESAVLTQAAAIRSVQEAIEGRRSIRKFVPEPVNPKDLQEILRLASLAPSAFNLQPWRFHVVEDLATRQKLREAAFGQPQVTSAPVVILVASDMEDTLEHLEETQHPGMSLEQRRRIVRSVRETYGQMSVAERGQWALTQANIALGFLLLAAQGMGYATVPMLGFDQAKVREILGLPDHVLFAAMVCLGRPAEAGYPHHRFPLERIVTYH